MLPQENELDPLSLSEGNYSSVVKSILDEYLSLPQSKHHNYNLLYSESGDLTGITIREVERYWGGNQVGYPTKLLADVAAHAQDPKEAFYVTDYLNSEKFTTYIGKCNYKAGDSSLVASLGNSRQIIARQLVKIMAESEQNAHDILVGITERLDEMGSAGERMLKLMPFLESAIGYKLSNAQESSDLDASSIDRISRLAWMLEQRGLLKEESEIKSLLSFPAALMYHQIAEILLSRLVEKPVEVGSKRERAGIFLSKRIVKDLLHKYSFDENRHKQNVELIQKHIFPDPTRSESMSRDNLVALANYIRKTTKPQSEQLDSRSRGVVAPALAEVLQITTANDVPDSIYQTHRLEDSLYVSIVGMLLEQRNYQAK